MITDILYGKSIVHVIAADVILDHKNRGILRLGIFCILKILCSFFFKGSMQLSIGKSIIQGINNKSCFFAAVRCYLIFLRAAESALKSW